MSYFVYLKKDKQHEQFQKIHKVALYFRDHAHEILYNNRCIYPRLKSSDMRGNKAMWELKRHMGEEYDILDLNNFIKLTRRNEFLVTDDYLQLGKVDKVKEILTDYEEDVYVGEEPFVKILVTEEKIEDRLDLIKEIIHDEGYEIKELKELISYILTLI